MKPPISFSDEIAQLEGELEQARARLEELKSRWKAYDFETQECRSALEKLRATLAGELPDREEADAVDPIAPVPINPETGRPQRGARRRQLAQICRKIGASGASFRTIEVLDELRKIEGELSSGMKSYTYAVMNTLEDDGLLTKVGRGRWKLAALGA